MTTKCPPSSFPLPQGERDKMRGYNPDKKRPFPDVKGSCLTQWLEGYESCHEIKFLV